MWELRLGSSWPAFVVVFVCKCVAARFSDQYLPSPRSKSQPRAPSCPQAHHDVLQLLAFLHLRASHCMHLYCNQACPTPTPTHPP